MTLRETKNRKRPPTNEKKEKRKKEKAERTNAKKTKLFRQFPSANLAPRDNKNPLGTSTKVMNMALCNSHGAIAALNDVSALEVVHY